MRTLEYKDGTADSQQMRGTDVDAWKAFLVSQGFSDVGRAQRGTFGPKTRAATTAFQKKVGLQGLGVVGPKTLEAARQSGFKAPAPSSTTARAEERAARNTLATPTAELRRRYPWMDVAYKELGVREISGGKHNARVVGYHSATPLSANDDETPWCASFVSWCFKEAGVPAMRSARAFDWLKWQGGERIETPLWGCIVVFKYSHVAFYVGPSATGGIRKLGGNQSNKMTRNGVEVNISNDLQRNVRGYIWPKGWAK